LTNKKLIESHILNYRLITTNEDLHHICELAVLRKAVALDTEFVRTKTYYAELGLIQLYDGHRVSLIDPFLITEWAPFYCLLKNKKIVKFLHSAGEDIEIFFHFFKTLPEPLIDSQILAAFTGRPVSCGFSILVKEFQGIVLNKAESRTDWLARPLSQKQCDYAAEDVFYLLPLANALMKKIETSGWMEAVKEECELLCQRRSQIQDPEMAYRDIGNASQLNPGQLICLKKLASWRLVYARKKNVAINFVIQESYLWKVARYQPTSLSELFHLGLDRRTIRQHGLTLLGLVTESQKTKEDPSLVIAYLNHEPVYKKIFKEIKDLIQSIGALIGLSHELIGSRKHINQLLNWHFGLIPKEKRPLLLTGWRAQVLSLELTKILDRHPMMI